MKSSFPTWLKSLSISPEMYQLTEYLREVLPAECWDHATDKINLDHYDGGSIYETATVFRAGTFVRRNSEFFGWTINPSPKGPSRPGINRLTKVELKKEGIIPPGDPRSPHIINGKIGAFSNVETSLTTMKYHMRHLKSHVPHHRQPNYEDMLDDLVFFERKLNRFVTQFRNDRRTGTV